MKSIEKDWNTKKVTGDVEKLLSNYDDGELFVEKKISENFSFDDNKIKTASYDVDQGFGLRVVNSDSSGFAHSSELSYNSFKIALEAVRSIKKSSIKRVILPKKTNNKLYSDKNPIDQKSFKSKIDLLQKINSYARNLDSNVNQVSVSLAGNYQQVEIYKQNGEIFYDYRPLVRLNVTVSVKKK